MTVDPATRTATLVVDEELHDLDAIYGAAYLFVDRCFVFLDRPADRKVEITLRARGDADADALTALAGELSNELLNQSLRKRVGEANARLREMILARALFAADGPTTIDRLLAELDAEEMAAESLDIPVPWAKNADG